MTPEWAYNTLELHFPQSIEWNTGSVLGGLELRVTTALGELESSPPGKSQRLS